MAGGPTEVGLRAVLDRADSAALSSLMTVGRPDAGFVGGAGLSPYWRAGIGADQSPAALPMGSGSAASPRRQ